MIFGKVLVQELIELGKHRPVRMVSQGDAGNIGQLSCRHTVVMPKNDQIGGKLGTGINVGHCMEICHAGTAKTSPLFFPVQPVAGLVIDGAEAFAAAHTGSVP